MPATLLGKQDRRKHNCGNYQTDIDVQYTYGFTARFPTSRAHYWRKGKKIKNYVLIEFMRMANKILKHGFIV